MTSQFRQSRQVFLLLAALFLAACAEPDPEPRTVQPAAAIDASQGESLGFSLYEKPRTLDGIQFADDAGQSLSLNNFKGKVVLLNVWATWCPPCREEMPTLDRLQAALGGDDFEVLALSVDQAGVDVVKTFFQKIDIRHLQLYIDPSAKASRVMNVMGLPTTLLLDRQGRELGRVVGDKVWDSPAMVAFFKDVIKQTATAERER